MAVVIILVIIALIVTPLILNILHKARKSAFQDSAYGILESGNLLYADMVLNDEVKEQTFLFDGENRPDLEYSGEVPKGGILQISESGEVSLALHNNEWCALKGKEEENITMIKYEEGKCIIPDHGVDSIITLNGDKTVYIEIGKEYQEEGATVKTSSGEELDYITEIKLNDEVVNNIDTSHEATYQVIYKVINDSKTISVTRTVVIVDMTPVITMTEPEVNYVKEQEILINVSGIKPNKVEGFTYQINEEDPIEVKGLSKIVVLNKTGEIKVKVTVTDDHGHRNELSKTYKIDGVPPVLTFEDVTLKIDEVTGYDLMTGVTVKDNSGVTPTVTYTGGLSATVGTQTITYKATDEAGNVETKVRTFTVIEADVPIISFSPIGTTGWVKSVNITITATVKIGEVLSEFYYSINSGERQNGRIDGHEGTASITLNSTGNYTISAEATGGWGNKKTENSGTYYIDATKPIVGEIEGNTSTWTTSKTLTTTLTDENSGISAYAVTTNDIAPAENASIWIAIESAESYHFSHTVTENNTYYIWVKDGAGNVSTSQSVHVSTIDTITPSLTVSDYNGKVGDDVLLSTKYKATFGEMGGNVVCKYGNTVITNVNYFEAGTYTVLCTAYGNNGKNSGAKTMSITVVNPSISGSQLATNVGLPNVAGGYRYQGVNPNNYVSFNGEAYRIIGIFNGQMKIIYWGNYTPEGQLYGNTKYKWNSSSKNEWSSASLMTEFNTNYWGRINATARDMVDQNHVWNLGGWDSSEINRATMYEKENGTTVYSGRPTKWTGKIALMYPSDYAYATNGGNICDNTILLDDWNEGNKGYKECAQKSWLYSSKEHQWTLTPRSNYSNYLFTVSSRGFVGADSVSSYLGVRPVLYLKSDVKIIGGNGTASEPYTLSG